MTNNHEVRGEFHCHSVYSADSLMQIENLLAVCRKRHIDKIAITDHNCLEGALRAYQLDPARVIVGEEIQTTQGEILGYFMSEEIPEGLEPMEVVKRLKEQDAFISVAHPFDLNRDETHWQPGMLESLVPQLDAIEVFNARCLQRKFNEQAQDFACKHNLIEMAGSDAHSPSELGRATLLLPLFNNVEEFRQAIKQAKIDARLSGSYVHLFSAWAKLVKKVRKSASLRS